MLPSASECFQFLCDFGLALEIQQMQARLRVLARTNLAFVTVAALAMATARYW